MTPATPTPPDMPELKAPPLMPRFGLGDIVTVTGRYGNDWQGQRLLITGIDYNPKRDRLTYQTHPAENPASEGGTDEWDEQDLSLYQTNKFNTRPTPPADAMPTEGVGIGSPEHEMLCGILSRIEFHYLGYRLDDPQAAYKIYDDCYQALRELENFAMELVTKGRALQSPAPVTDAQREALEIARKRILYLGAIAGDRHNDSNYNDYLPIIDAALSAPVAKVDAEDLAKLFHDTYERLATKYGYETRKETSVPWPLVPVANKRLMIAVCDEVLHHLTPKTPEGE